MTTRVTETRVQEGGLCNVGVGGDELVYGRALQTAVGTASSVRTETRTAEREGAGVHTTQVAVFGYCEASVERTLGHLTRRENVGEKGGNIEKSWYGRWLYRVGCPELQHNQAVLRACLANL